MSKKDQKIDFIDRFENVSRGSMDWIAKRTALVLGALLVLIAGVGISMYWTFSQSNKEASLQSKYFEIEKRYVELRRGFDEAAGQAKVAAATPAKKDAPKPAPVASGDMAKDFGGIPGEFEALVDSAPQSVAAEMAALNGAELYMRYQQKDKALAILKKVNTANRTSDFTDALVIQSRASLMADAGDCKGAIGLWEKLAQSSSTKYLQDESKLRMGLCYENQQDLGKAEQLYKEVAAKDPKQPEQREAGRDAERYLHLLKMKQSAHGG